MAVCCQAVLLDSCLLSEMRIGSMLKEIPKASGARTDLKPNVHEDKRLQTKTEKAEELGFSPKQVSQFQRMAEHEDVNSQNENPACTGKRDSQQHGKRKKVENRK